MSFFFITGPGGSGTGSWFMHLQATVLQITRGFIQPERWYPWMAVWRDQVSNTLQVVMHIQVRGNQFTRCSGYKMLRAR